MSGFAIPLSSITPYFSVAAMAVRIRLTLDCLPLMKDTRSGACGDCAKSERLVAVGTV
jgi:hypothetical protein